MKFRVFIEAGEYVRTTTGISGWWSPRFATRAEAEQWGRIRAHNGQFPHGSIGWEVREAPEVAHV